MNKTVRYLLSAMVVLTLLLGSVTMAPAARSEASIHLKSGVFVPSQLESAAQASGRYFIVQFAGPVEQSWKDALTAEGAEVLGYIPTLRSKCG